MNIKITPKQIVYTAFIAAIYFVVAAIFAPLSFGPVQVRIAEALTLLPIITPLAIPGTFIGCLIANIVFSASMLDIILGSLATLIAAILTYMLRENKYIAALPPVIINAFVVAYVLKVSVGAPYWMTVFTVGVGQAVSCYAIGIPFVAIVKKYLPEAFNEKW